MKPGRKFSFKVEKAAESVLNYLNSKQLEEAFDLAQKNLKRKHKHPVFFFAQSIQFLVGGDSATFREQFNAISNLTAVNHADYYNFGIFFQTFEVDSLAVECFGKSVEFKSDFTEGYIQLANSIFNLKEYDAALGAYVAAFELDKNNKSVALRAGTCLENMGHFDKALDYYQKLYDDAPLDSDVRVAVARCLINLERAEEAEFVVSKNIDQATKKELDYLLLVKILKDRNELTKALHIALAAYEVNSHSLPVLKIYGTLLCENNHSEEAKKILKKVIIREPSDIGSLFNYGNSCQKLGEISEAIEYFEKTIVIDENYYGAYNNLAHAYEAMGNHKLAQQHYNKALEISPESAEYHSNILFNLLHMDDSDPVEHLRQTKIWQERHAAPVNERISSYKVKKGSAKLRIGYISGDFGDHVAAYFWMPIARHHDRDKFEIYLYSQLVRDDDLSAKVNKNIDQICDLKRDVSKLTDQELCKQIVDDEINILIDLSGHTACNRLTALSYKPAPIQASYIGYPATTGLDTIDYYITQPFSAPIEDADLYVEKLVHIPGCTSYNIRAGGEKIQSKPLPFAENGFITFGSFNRPGKVSEECLHVWMAILQQVPNSQLLIKTDGSGEDDFKNLIFGCADEAGVHRDRMILTERCGFLDYLEQINGFDIGLDPFPYNGATTSLDLFYMGRSFVSLKGGKAFQENIGASFLSFFGQDEMIALSEEEYIAKAIWAAENIAEFEGKRLALRETFNRDVADSGARVCASLERSFEIMWDRYCENIDPDHILLPAA